MVTWDDGLTQAGKKRKEQGRTGNIFNIDQFCPSISAFSLKTPSAHGETNNRRAKTHKHSVWASY